MSDTATATTEAKTNATKVKKSKINVTIPVSIEYGKNEKGAYTAKVLGLKGKDGKDLYYTNKDKGVLKEKAEKGAASAAKYYFESTVCTGGTCSG